MKKTAVLGFVLFMSIFAHTSKTQQKTQRNPTMKYHINNQDLQINSNNHLQIKLDEPMEYIPFRKMKQQPTKHYSRNHKGKLST